MFVDLGGAVGHEQMKRRPCIVLSSDDVVAQLRFPLVVVVPVTKTKQGPLYPVVGPYPGSLTAPSTVLVDNIRGIDKVRISMKWAPVPAADLALVEHALAKLLALKLA